MPTVILGGICGFRTSSCMACPPIIPTAKPRKSAGRRGVREAWSSRQSWIVELCTHASCAAVEAQHQQLSRFCHTACCPVPPACCCRPSLTLSFVRETSSHLFIHQNIKRQTYQLRAVERACSDIQHCPRRRLMSCNRSLALQVSAHEIQSNTTKLLIL